MRYRRDARDAALDRVEQRFRWVIDAAPAPGGGTAGVRGAF